MQNVMRLVVLALVFVAGSATAAETRIPDSTYGDDRSAEASAIAKKVDANLRQTIAYWRTRGFDRPLRLDSVQILPSWDRMTVAEAVLALNPDLGTSPEDVVRHVAAQHLHFLRSPLHRKLNDLAMENGIEPGALTRLWFDSYAQIRYGYSFPNFYEEVILNGPMDRVYADVEQVRPTANAYYGRFPKIDLTKHLPLKIGKGDRSAEVTLAFLSLITSAPDTITFWDLVERSTEGMAARIVFLPSMMQAPYDYAMSLGNDLSVGSHEVGHTLIGSIGEVPRQIDEYMADMIAAIYHRDGKVGAYFSKIAGMGLERALRAPLSDADEQRRRVERLESMARQGALRNLNDTFTIDNLTRYTAFADPYEAGHPLRTLSWGIWKALAGRPETQVQFERVLLGSIERMANRSVIVPARAQVLLNLRKLGLAMVNQKLLANEEKRRRESPRPEDAGTSAARAVRILQEEREARAQENAAEKIRAGQFVARPAIGGDYISLEYLRDLAYAAQDLGFTELLAPIQEHASRAMNATAEFIDAAGKQHLVFFRRAGDRRSATIRSKLRQLFDAIDATKKSLALGGTATGSGHKAAQRALLDQLERAMGAVQEFEIHGNGERLTDPYPGLEKKLAQLKALQESCGQELVEQAEEES